MSAIHIEHANQIYADRLREAEHHRLVNTALAGRQNKARNPIQILAKLVLRLVHFSRNPYHV